jgi:hypothetical protein
VSISMKSEKDTVSVRLEIDKDVHKKVKLIQAKMLLDGKDYSISDLCGEMLTKGVNSEIENLQIEVK